jgi:hypothetical protein
LFCAFDDRFSHSIDMTVHAVKNHLNFDAHRFSSP